MYQQPNHSYSSTDSFKRVSSNNPFRQSLESPTKVSTTIRQQYTSNSNHSNGSGSHSKAHRHNTPPNFDDWVLKNKQLLDLSDEDDDDDDNYGLSVNHRGDNYNYRKPIPPKPVRTGSDSSINYGKKSNNPFAGAYSEDEPSSNNRENTVRRHPTQPNSQSKSQSKSQSQSHHPTQKPPSRPPKPDSLPSYEEVAGPEAATKDYPREKSSSSSSNASSSGSRSHRHHSSERSKPSSGSRHHSGHRSSRNRSPSKKKPAEPVKAKNLDTIDKLDVTAFFGGGFHHDGPFDACTPHRNKNSKVAPVAAFPIDGPNNSIKGLAGNIDKNEQMNLAFGTYEEDQNEIVGRRGPAGTEYISPGNSNVARNGSHNSNSNININPINNNTDMAIPSFKINSGSTIYTNPSVVDFNANIKAEPIHGEISQGLGSTTFLDGAPASRAAETQEYYASVNGIGRKKSIVQRLRKNSATSENSSRRNSNDSTDITRKGSFNQNTNTKSLSTDELKPSSTSGSGNGASSLIRRVKSLKVRR
ncbi:Pal1 cell morphology protein-domain-containing protein [Scheffersomyces amazonensis]|uniref:Pal1 cell morphology protein-domain-containing protein n=1 Tax=Scheffersomyces amazonensis TaxID=1078765 RepID=UPI00315D4FF4